MIKETIMDFQKDQKKKDYQIILVKSVRYKMYKKINSNKNNNRKKKIKKLSLKNN